MPRIVVAVVGVLLIAATGSIAMQAAVESGADQRTIVNETFTPASAGQVATLSASDRDDVTYSRTRAVTVYNVSGERMVPGDDYEWVRSNGTVRTLADGGINNTASANITYGYARPTQSQQELAVMLAQIPQMVGLAAPFLAFVLFLRFVG